MARLFLFGNRGYASLILQDLLSRDADVVGICTRPPPALRGRLRRRFGRLLRQLHLRQDEGFSRPGPFDALPAPAEIARAARIEVHWSRDLKSAAFRQRLHALAPDLILVAGFHRLVPPAVYAEAQVAAVNFHPALLPAHQGGTPNRWVVRHGERQTGITAHLLSDSFDTGDVVAQRHVPVQPDDTWGDVEQRIAGQMVPFVDDVIAQAMAGRLQPKPQSPDAGRYEHSYGDADRIIDWTLAAEEIRRTCYAIRPKSGGLAAFSGRRLCVWDLVVDAPSADITTPGTIVAVDDTGAPIVACGTGAVRVTQFLRRGQIVPAGRVGAELRWAAGNRFDAMLPVDAPG